MGQKRGTGRDLVMGAYRLLVRLLPADFRETFGQEMIRLFRDRLEEVEPGRDGGAARYPTGHYGHGPAPERPRAELIRLASGAFLDLLSTILRERWARFRGRLPGGNTDGPASGSEYSAMQTLLRDLRHALRIMKKQPGHTALSTLTLGLGIGATTVAFSLVNGILLKPLPFPDSEELAYLMEEGARGQELMLSYPNFDDWRTGSAAFQDIAAVQFSNVASVLGGEEPTRGTVLGVSREFFRVLGVAPIRGRPILPEENRPGGERVVVVGYEFWASALGARGDLESLTLDLYGASWQVVGVMPPGFRVLEKADLYIPMELNPVPVRSAHNYRGIGRLAPGVSLDRADRELDRIAANIKAEYGDDTSSEAAAVRPLREAVVGDAENPLLLLLAASGVLLLIACTNQASNLLARGTHRQREMAIRSAMGAGRRRLIQQLLVESGLLAALGCGLGLALTFGTLRGLRVLGPDLVPRMDSVAVDPAVLLFALLAALATSFLFGLMPAFRATESVSGALSRAGQWGSTGAGRRAWDLLVGAEVAMAVVLITGSALLVRSLQEIVEADTGFRGDGVVAVELDPSGQGFDTEESRTALFRDLEQRASRIPEVAVVGMVNRLPLQARTWTGPVLRSPVSDRENRDEWVAIAGWRVADEDYFAAMNIPVLAGRTFDPVLDGPDSPPVAVLNRSLAEKAFPGEDPLGKQVQALWDRREEDFTVVGVVAEARDWRRAPGAQPEMFVYWPQRLEHTGYMTAVLRPREGRVIPAAEVRDAVRAVAPSMPLEIRSVDALLGESLKERRFTLIVLGCFAVAALLLSAVGIYGVVSYTVSRRTREMGIRLALGARPGLLRRRIFSGSMRVVLAGATLGLAGALLGGRIMESLLYGITPRDPLALALAPLVLFAAAALAVWIPVRRYTRVDPSVAMEVE